MCMAVLPFERLRRRLFDPGRITNGISSVHDVTVAIDVKRLAGDEARGVVRQESGGDAHIVDAHQTARRRFRLGLVEQGVEFGKSARMEGDHSLPVSPMCNAAVKHTSPRGGTEHQDLDLVRVSQELFGKVHGAKCRAIACGAKQTPVDNSVWFLIFAFRVA